MILTLFVQDMKIYLIINSDSNLTVPHNLINLAKMIKVEFIPTVQDRTMSVKDLRIKRKNITLQTVLLILIHFAQVKKKKKKKNTIQIVILL